MKNIKFLIGVMVSIIVLTYSFYTYATTTQDDERPEEPQKTVRIIIEQSGDIKGSTNLPFQSIARKLSEYAELKVVAPESQDYDYTLKIQARGSALGENYSTLGFGTGTRYYTGASLSGTITLEVADVPLHEVSFSGKISPPRQIDTSKESTSPSRAPFDKAFNSSGFASKATKMLGEVYGTPFLLNALKDSDRDVQMIAKKELEGMGMAAVEPLIAALFTEDTDVRKAAAQMLGEIKDPRAVEPLIVALNDENEDVRIEARKALEGMGTAAVEPLIAALNTEDADVREAAVKALGESKDPRAVEPLITALMDEDADVRKTAAQALKETKDPQAIALLITALKDEDADVRKTAAQTLGEIKDPQAVEPLITVLKDEDADIRKTAAQALGEIKDPQAVEALFVALNDKDSSVREAAVEALEKMGEAAVDILAATLQNSDFRLRVLAVQTLGKIKDPCAVNLLITALQDKEFVVQAKVAEALGEIQDSRAIEPLINAMKSGTVLVRKNAADALRKITQQSFGQDYEAWLKWWKEFSKTLPVEVSPRPIQAQDQEEQRTEERQGVIRIQSGSPVYSKPNGGTIVARIQTIIDVKVLEQSGQWYKVITPGGITGWVSEDHVSDTE